MAGLLLASRAWSISGVCISFRPRFRSSKTLVEKSSRIFVRRSGLPFERAAYSNTALFSAKEELAEDSLIAKDDSVEEPRAPNRELAAASFHMQYRLTCSNLTRSTLS